MNRIEQFLLLDTKPLITSYYSPILSALINTKGAEYPFTPLLESSSSMKFRGFNATSSSQGCSIDDIAKRLELKLFYANEYTRNALTIFWGTVWDAVTTFFLGFLSLVPDLFTTIKDIVIWFFGLFEPNSEERAELDAIVAGIGGFFASFDWRTIPNLTAELAALTQQFNDTNAEWQRADAEFVRWNNAVSLIEEKINFVDNRLNGDGGLVEQLEEARYRGNSDTVQKLGQQIMRHEEELTRLYNRRNIAAENLRKATLYWAEVRQRLDDILRAKAYKIKELEQVGGFLKSLERLKDLLKRILKNKTIQKLFSIVAAFAAGLGAILVAGLEIIGAILLIVSAAYVISLCTDLVNTCLNACQSLLDAVEIANEDRRAALPEYYDEIDLRVSSGCCDNPICRKPNGDFNGCPQLGCGSSSSGPGVGVGAFVGQKVFVGSSETTKFCGYKSGCLSLPNCLNYIYPVPSGDSQPYTTSNWRYKPGFTAYDRRQLQLEPGAREAGVTVPDPESACGWRIDDVFFCPDWNAIKTTFNNWAIAAWLAWANMGVQPGTPQDPTPATPVTPPISVPPISGGSTPSLAPGSNPNFGSMPGLPFGNI